MDTTLTKVFVGGLSFETTNISLKNHFKKYGPISEAVVIYDRQHNRSKGYGFVTFQSADSATRATRIANPKIDGRTTNCILAYLGAKKFACNLLYIKI